MRTETSERIQRQVSRSGQLNVVVLGTPYHSRYNPEREARQFLAEFPVEEADVVILMGWGLGYAGAPLADRLRSDARVLVLEPDGELFEFYEKSCPRFTDGRFRFVSGNAVDQFFDSRSFECHASDRYLWIDWPQAAELHGARARHIRSRFTARLRDQAGNLLTHFQNGRLYFENAMANLAHAADPTVGRLFGRFENVPVVLVSAGPSLDLNVRELRGARSGAFILAVDTALRPLLAAGVRPHAVVIADPSALNARHVEGAVPTDTFLIAEQGIHPRAMAAAARRFQFSVGVFPDTLYAEFGLPRDSLQVWGSVATAALDLACRMGADPVIFAGQDFAFSWGRAYASGTIFDGLERVPAASERRETDLWGVDVPTSEDLLAYRDHFRRRIAAEPGRRFVNATEGGILTGDGIEILSLRDAVHRYSVRNVDVQSRLEDCYRISDRSRGIEMSTHLESVLSDRTRSCGCLDGFLELVAKEALVRGDADMANAMIARGIEVSSEVAAAAGPAATRG